MEKKDPEWILKLKEYAKTLPSANLEAILESDRNSIGIVKNPEVYTKLYSKLPRRNFRKT